MNYLVLAILLTLTPFIELRGGLPLAVFYALKNNLSSFFIFLLILFINIFLIFLIFFFLDKLHHLFLKIKLYRVFFDFYLKSIQKKVKKFIKKYSSLGFLALIIFVAIPLPGTGVYTGVFLSWFLNLERKKSILAISIGTIIAGIIIYLVSLGLFSFKT